MPAPAFAHGACQRFERPFASYTWPSRRMRWQPRSRLVRWGIDFKPSSLSLPLSLSLSLDLGSCGLISPWLRGQGRCNLVAGLHIEFDETGQRLRLHGKWAHSSHVTLSVMAGLSVRFWSITCDSFNNIVTTAYGSFSMASLWKFWCMTIVWWTMMIVYNPPANH